MRQARPLVAALTLALLAACGKPVAPAMVPAGAMAAQARGGGSFTTGTCQGRTYKLFVPAGLKPKAPLVVVMHGCTQDPDDMAKGTRFNELAAKQGFAVLYPARTRQDHPMACMPWFDADDMARGQGFPAQVVAMVDQVAKQNELDRGAVYLAGISAGAAFAVNAAAAYPDVFSGLCVVAGLEFAAATNEMAARMAMLMGGPDPKGQGKKAFEAMGTFARPMPVIVFGGSADYVVNQVNAGQVVAQWAATNDLVDDGKANGSVDATADETERAQAPGGRSYTRTVFHDAKGKPILERVAVDMMGHAWPGGDKAGSYTDPAGPDATTMAWTFFQAHARRKGAK